MPKVVNDALYLSSIIVSVLIRHSKKLIILVVVYILRLLVDAIFAMETRTGLAKLD